MVWPIALKIRGGLIDSLRWEQMRNGLQDYECLWLLEQKTSQIKATLAPRAAGFIDPRQRGVEIASRVDALHRRYVELASTSERAGV